MDFLIIHPDNLQSADSQVTNAGPFSKVCFLGWDFHSVFPDECSNTYFFYFSNCLDSVVKDLPKKLNVFFLMSSQIPWFVLSDRIYRCSVLELLNQISAKSRKYLRKDFPNDFILFNKSKTDFKTFLILWCVSYKKTRNETTDEKVNLSVKYVLCGGKRT